eukprot:TRINITY_DN29486_c0_g1_i1.p1 TRINITY_DN29486_c0_g1~~TRINITY_DN29486_c0_g1_i1.p1  ORF type:complete len:943 (+),score=135.38 TRINITY_DN29486_c0_g1_i1:107-2830(+)
MAALLVALADAVDRVFADTSEKPQQRTARDAPAAHALRLLDACLADGVVLGSDWWDFVSQALDLLPSHTAALAARRNCAGGRRSFFGGSGAPPTPAQQGETWLLLALTGTGPGGACALAEALEDCVALTDVLHAYYSEASAMGGSMEHRRAVVRQCARLGHAAIRASSSDRAAVYGDMPSAERRGRCGAAPGLPLLPSRAALAAVATAAVLLCSPEAPQPEPDQQQQLSAEQQLARLAAAVDALGDWAGTSPLGGRSTLFASAPVAAVLMALEECLRCGLYPGGDWWGMACQCFDLLTDGSRAQQALRRAEEAERDERAAGAELRGAGRRWLLLALSSVADEPELPPLLAVTLEKMLEMADVVAAYYGEDSVFASETGRRRFVVLVHQAEQWPMRLSPRDLWLFELRLPPPMPRSQAAGSRQLHGAPETSDARRAGHGQRADGEAAGSVGRRSSGDRIAVRVTHAGRRRAANTMTHRLSPVTDSFSDVAHLDGSPRSHASNDRSGPESVSTSGTRSHIRRVVRRTVVHRRPVTPPRSPSHCSAVSVASAAVQTDLSVGARAARAAVVAAVAALRCGAVEAGDQLREAALLEREQLLRDQELALDERAAHCDVAAALSAAEASQVVSLLDQLHKSLSLSGGPQGHQDGQHTRQAADVLLVALGEAQAIPPQQFAASVLSPPTSPRPTASHNSSTVTPPPAALGGSSSPGDGFMFASGAGADAQSTDSAPRGLESARVTSVTQLGGNAGYYVYTVQTKWCSPPEIIAVQHRFSDFYRLREELRKRHRVASATFPHRIELGKSEKTKAGSRLPRLDEWLARVATDRGAREDPVLIAFLRRGDDGTSLPGTPAVTPSHSALGLPTQAELPDPLPGTKGGLQHETSAGSLPRQTGSHPRSARASRSGRDLWA